MTSLIRFLVKNEIACTDLALEISREDEDLYKLQFYLCRIVATSTRLHKKSQIIPLLDSQDRDID